MKKYSKFFAVLLAVAMMLPGVAQVAQAAEVAEDSQVTRLGGIDREETAVLASQEAYQGGAEAVVLAGFGGDVDALTGTLLAGAKKGPLLITRQANLSPVTKNEIERLDAKTVYILGGETVVSAAVETELEEDYTVKRIAGDNREETAAAVAKEVKDAKATHVFLALGRMAKETDALADALAIGPVSIMKNMPVLLTRTNEVPAATLKAMGDLGVTHITLVGGTSAISAELETELKKDYEVDRVGGNSRENTALEIAKKYFPNAKNLIVAYGRKSADALVGGYLGALRNAPILLTNNAGLTAETKAYMQTNRLHTYILGGEKVVSKQVEEEIKTLLKADKKLEVESVSAINDTTLLVVMSDGTVHEVELEAGQKLKLNRKNKVSFAVNGVYYEEEVLYTEDSVKWEKDIEKYHKEWNESKDRANEATKNLADATTKATWADKYGTDKQKVEAARVLAAATVDEAAAAADLALASANLAGAIFQSYQAVQYEEVLAMVEKAERSNNQIDVDRAEEAIDFLYDGGLTPEYDISMDTLEKLLLIPSDHKIPGYRAPWDDSDGRLQDLEERLDEVQNIIDATESVEGLEKFVAEEDFHLNNAKDWYKGALADVNALKDGPAKTDLLNRLKAVKVILDDASTAYLEKEATDAVEFAEAHLEAGNINAAKADHDRAKGLVEALEDGDVKTDLLARLAVVEAGVEKALAEFWATEAVKAAENNQTQDNVDAAQDLIDELEDEDVKTKLQERLDAVKDAMEERAVEAAEVKVGSAETWLEAKNYDNALSEYNAALPLVEALKGGEAKTDLEARLATVKEEIDKHKTAEEQAGVVYHLINDLTPAPSLTLEDKDAVVAVRAAYEALSDDAQALVSNITHLEVREAKIAELEAYKVALMFKDGNGVASHLDIKISELGHVRKAVKAYNELDDDQKEMVKVTFAKATEVAKFKAALASAGL